MAATKFTMNLFDEQSILIAGRCLPYGFSALESAAPFV